MEQTFDANGVSINYAVGPAAGPPLLLLHGIAESWRTFLPLIPGLAGRWQPYALDLRGHGRSQRVENRYRVVDYAGDVASFLESQISGPAVILGHSLGALVAIYVAVNFSKQVRAIVLVDPPLHIQHTPLKDIPNGPYESFKQIVELIRADPSPQAIERNLIERYPDGSAEAHRNRAAVLSQLDPDALASFMEGQHLSGLDLDAFLGQIECPTLLLQGDPELGAALLDADAERALVLLRHGAWMRIHGAGHMLHGSHPQVVLDAIDNFCDRNL